MHPICLALWLATTLAPTSFPTSNLPTAVVATPNVMTPNVVTPNVVTPTPSASTAEVAFLPTAPKPSPATAPASELVASGSVGLERIDFGWVEGLLVAAKDWIGKAADNICGLRDIGQVSNPALVDWQACLDATPEMKKAKADKVDLDTPEGIKLSTAATNRVTTACDATRTANGYCSVWKTIKHKDGRAIPDITDLVKAQY